LKENAPVKAAVVRMASVSVRKKDAQKDAPAQKHNRCLRHAFFKMGGGEIAAPHFLLFSFN